jgi:hypothetical protein
MDCRPTADQGILFLAETELIIRDIDEDAVTRLVISFDHLLRKWILDPVLHSSL